MRIKRPDPEAFMFWVIMAAALLIYVAVMRVAINTNYLSDFAR